MVTLWKLSKRAILAHAQINFAIFHQLFRRQVGDRGEKPKKKTPSPFRRKVRG